MSVMVSYVLSLFPRGVLDEILNLIESVSEGFPSYSFISRVCKMSSLTLSHIYHWEAPKGQNVYERMWKCIHGLHIKSV